VSQAKILAIDDQEKSEMLFFFVFTIFEIIWKNKYDGNDLKKKRRCY
jgi:hypothetical protein